MNPDFAVIYRGYVKPGREADYQTSWQTVANYFVTHCGALGSRLHRTADGMWVAYSRWPNKEMRDAAWPGDSAPSDALPQEVRSAIITLKECLDPERALPDILLEVVLEVVKKVH